MLTKRQVLKTGVTATVALTAPTFLLPLLPADAQSMQPGRLQAVQKGLNLDVSIGSLFGAALGAAIYLAFARKAPSELVASFARALIVHSQSSSVLRPARDYIEYRVSDASGNLSLASQRLNHDINLDAVAFNSLAEAVRQQSITLENLRRSNEVSIREARRMRYEIRQELETIKLEQSRARSSASTYTIADNEISVSRIDKQRTTAKPIVGAIQNAKKLERHCRDLQDQLMTVR